LELPQVYELIALQVQDGEIRQYDFNAGDSAQRGGTFWVLTGLLGADKQQIERTTKLTYEKNISSHEVGPGIYRRTKDSSDWAFNPNNFSRDQWSILQLAFAVQGDERRLRESMWALIKRCGFHQNVHIGTDTVGTWKDYKVPDFSAPTHLSVFIRGMSLKVLTPLLPILDLAFIGDLYFRNGSVDYDNMLSQQLLYANAKYPTLVSKFAMRAYLKTDFMKKIERYHEVSEGRNGIKGFYELFKLAYERLTGAKL
jgi:hypothetical protein